MYHRFGRFPAAVFCALCVPAAQAALTTVNVSGGGNGAERCLAGASCAQGAYAGSVSIVRAFEIDLGLAAGSLQRVSDARDKEWITVSSDAALRPVARYAGDDSRLAVRDGAGGITTLSPVLANFDVWVDHPSLFPADPRHGDFSRNPFSWSSIPGTPGTLFSFVLNNLSSSLRLSSNTGLAGFSNSGYTQDWMVTYRVPGQNLYLVAWEDRRNIGANGLPNDYDYNDYVFAVRGVSTLDMQGQGDPAPTPLPPAAALLLVGLGFLGAAAHRGSTPR
jgi:hypothetical protein